MLGRSGLENLFLLFISFPECWNAELFDLFFLVDLQVLAEKLPELLDFPTDLKSLEASTKVHLLYVNM